MKNYKKYLVGTCSLFFLCTQVFYASEAKLVPQGHWLYDALTDIFTDMGNTALVFQAPSSVAELQTYLNEVDVGSLSDFAKRQYERVQDFFGDKKAIISSNLLSLGAGLTATPEFYARTNDDIDYSIPYFYKDWFLAMPVFLEAANLIYVEGDIFWSRNYWSLHNKKNFFNAENFTLKYNTYVNSNFPLNFDAQAFEATEFDFMRTAYMSISAPINNKYFFNFTVGRGSMSIGQTQTGSIIFSENFETDGYAKLVFFSPNLRYTLTASQTDSEKYLYLHKFDFRLFKKLQLSFMEGTFVNAPFEIRHLNPFMVVHNFSNWLDGKPACAYLAAELEWTPTKNLRLYFLYAQNEIKFVTEKDEPQPLGIGAQAGASYTLPCKKGAWKFGLETMYTMPYLYVKEQPDGSLITFKKQTAHGPQPVIPYTISWLGTPFGPDSVAASVNVSYEVPEKWNISLVYLFLAQGENAFADSLFFTASGDKRTDKYYPTGIGGEKGQQLANMLSPSGTPQYTNRISMEGSYFFSKSLSFSARTLYTVILNYMNSNGITKHGAEFALSCTYKIL